MAFGAFQQGDEHQPMSEINATPLVDVMLVLLVIFIITAPLFHQAVSIDPPRAAAAKLDDHPRVIAMAIDAAGIARVDGQPVPAASLEERLRAPAGAAGAVPEIHLRADRGTRYERITDVMSAAQRAGIARIAFVTAPVDAK